MNSPAPWSRKSSYTSNHVFHSLINVNVPNPFTLGVTSAACHTVVFERMPAQYSRCGDHNAISVEKAERGVHMLPNPTLVLNIMLDNAISRVHCSLMGMPYSDGFSANVATNTKECRWNFAESMSKKNKTCVHGQIIEFSDPISYGICKVFRALHLLRGRLRCLDILSVSLRSTRAPGCTLSD
jgi:hypothetical protein